MLKINLGSIVLMDLIITGICLSVMIQLWYEQRNKFPGLSFWLYFLLFQFIGLVLIVLRGVLTAWVSVVLANSLIVCGFIFLHLGLRRFLGKRNNIILNLGLVAFLSVFTCIHYYFTYVDNNLSMRIYNSAAGLFIGGSLCAWELFSGWDAPYHRIPIKAAVSCMVFAAFNLLRFAGNWVFPPQSSHFLETGGFDGISVGLMVGALAYMTFHLVMMVGTRLLFEVKENELALQASELRWITTLESIGEGVVTSDSAAKVTFMNAIAESMTGWKLNEALGNPITEVSRIINEMTKQTAENPVTRVLQEGLIVCHGDHSVLVQKDGTEIPVEYSCAPIRNMDAAHKGVIIVFRDVTERKLSEDALRRSEQKYRRLHESMTDGFVYVDMSGRIKEFNESYRQLLGYSHEELNRLTYVDVTPEKWHAYEEDIVNRQILPKGFSDVYEKEYIRKDGSDLPIELRTFLIRNDRGEAEGMWAIIRDISERKRMIQSLHESEEKFRALFDNVPMPYQSLDETGRIVDVNPAWLIALGYDRDAVIGKCFGEFLHPEDLPRFQDNFQEFARIGQVQNVEYRLLHNNGSFLDVSFNGRICRLPNGSFHRSYCVFRDISARKHLEMEKAKLDARRRQIQKAESLGRMAGAIAHQYNNLMGAVIGHLELARDRLPGESAIGDNLTEAMNSAQRAAEISTLMLTYLGLMPDKKEFLNLSDVCRHCLEILRASLPRQLNLKTDFSSPGPIIHGNRSQIQQALIRLVDNAREATDPNPGTIQLTVKTVPASDIPEFHRNPPNWQPTEPQYACLEVADSGCGIADTDLEKLFDPFFTSKFTGRGLGLPVVLGIIRSHRGVVTMESQTGQGSFFRIFLPVSSPEIQNAPEESPVTQKDMQGGTVLLVEDDPSVRRMAERMLETLGFRTLQAQNGREAVEMLSQHIQEIQCVMCDLTMPVMDGWETLASIRNVAPDIPVILTSGYVSSQVMSGNHSARPDAFLEKPYRTKDVQDAILQALQRRKKAKPDSIH